MRFVYFLIFFLPWTADLHSQTFWPQFRGPTGQGEASAADLPVTWSETENVTWRTSIPGKGWSSPVVGGHQIWMTTAIESVAPQDEKAERLNGEKQPNQRQVATSVSLRAVCVHRESGELLHDIELFVIEKPNTIHLLNSYASPTPVLENDRLYCHFGTFGTICINTTNAARLWERRIPVQHAVGPGSSPIIWNDLLVLVCDGMQEQYVAALDKETGETVWKSNRPPMEGDDGDFHKAYCTPLGVRWEGREQLIVPGAQWFVSYDPPTGKTLWQVNHGKGFSNVARPVFADGVTYMITGFTKPELWAMPVNVRGDLQPEDAKWIQKKQIPKKASPVVVQDMIYVISDSGVLSCIDLESGEALWTARVGGNYSASPLSVDGSIYLCNHEGKTTVVEPSREKYVKLAENQLQGQLMASPIALDAAIFIRSDKALYRIEK